MAIKAILSGFIALLIGLVAYLANKLGKKSAQLEAIKEDQRKQEEELAHAEKITNSVNAMDEYDVRQRLHEIANGQQK